VRVNEDEEVVTKSLVASWVQELTSFSFIMSSLVMLDVYSVMLDFSLKTQSDVFLAIHYPDTRNQLVGRLREIAAGTLGTVVVGHLECLGKRQIAFEVTKVRSYSKFPPKPTPPVKLTGCPQPNALRRKISAFQIMFTENLIDTVEKLLPVRPGFNPP